MEYRYNDWVVEVHGDHPLVRGLEVRSVDNPLEGDYPQTVWLRIGSLTGQNFDHLERLEKKDLIEIIRLLSRAVLETKVEIGDMI